MNESDKEDLWVPLLMVLILLIGVSTLASMFYFTYMIITGVYHLLDKLIDKI